MQEHTPVSAFGCSLRDVLVGSLLRADHQGLDVPVGCRQPKGRRTTLWCGLRAVCRQPLANRSPDLVAADGGAVMEW